MSKRLLLSSLLLLTCVAGILNFSLSVEARDNKNDKDKREKNDNNKNDKNDNDKNKNNNNDNKGKNDSNDNKQERREEKKEERKEEKKEERQDERKCGLKNDDKLRVSLDLANGRATFNNNEDHCTFKIGLASYNVYHTRKGPNDFAWLNTQTLFDYKSATIGPHQTTTLQVATPGCSYQLDAFRGEVVEEFNVRKKKDGGGYDGRIFAGAINSSLPLCGGAAPTPTHTPIIHPTATPTPTHHHAPTHTPTPTPQHITPTPTTHYVPPAVPTPVIQIINNNNNENHNNNEQTVIIEEGGVTREVIIEREVVVESGTVGTVVEEYIIEEEGQPVDVLGTTNKGKPVYIAPENVSKTPNTGAGALSLLALIPSGIAGIIIRRRLQ